MFKIYLIYLQFFTVSSKKLPLFSEQSPLASYSWVLFFFFYYWDTLQTYSVLSHFRCIYFLFMGTHFICLRSPWSSLPFDKWWYCGRNFLGGKARQLRLQELACWSSFLPDCALHLPGRKKSHSSLHSSVSGVIVFLWKKILLLL